MTRKPRVTKTPMSECITNETFQTSFLHMLWILRISQRLGYVISIYPDAIETGWCYTMTPTWRNPDPSWR
jgi:hypothetical protein